MARSSAPEGVSKEISDLIEASISKSIEKLFDRLSSAFSHSVEELKRALFNFPGRKSDPSLSRGFISWLNSNKRVSIKKTRSREQYVSKAAQF